MNEVIEFLFENQFQEAVKTGLKNQTIRRTTKAYLGQSMIFRNEDGERIGTGVCTYCHEIQIHKDHFTFYDIGTKESLYIDAPEQLEAFATADGFPSWSKLLGFICERYGDRLPFQGFITFWKLDERQPLLTSGPEFNILVLAQNSPSATLDTGMRCDVARQSACNWWSNRGSKIMQVEALRQAEPVGGSNKGNGASFMSLDPENPNFMPSGIMGGRLWDDLTPIEQVHITAVWVEHFTKEVIDV